MVDRIASWANLDFEAELAATKSYKAAPINEALCQRWSHVLTLLPEARSSHCLEGLYPEIDGKFEQLVAWGTTPRSLELADRLGAAPGPDLELVREINDKRYSHRLEKSLGVALPHSQIVDSLDQLEQAAQSCPFDWVLKHPLGYSGRERIFGKAHQLSDSARGWGRKKMLQGWSLLFEPWVDRQHDFSMHFAISRSGQPRYLGWCSLVSDISGGYRGNFVNRESEIDPRAVEVGHQVAAHLAAQGYWGPVGLDALSGHLGSTVVLRPLVEINARYSFGRLSLALADWLPQGWSYLWWHPSRAEAHLVPEKLPPLPDIGSSSLQPGIYQLPLLADPQQTSGTAIFTAPSFLEISQLQQTLLANSSPAISEKPPAVKPA